MMFTSKHAMVTSKRENILKTSNFEFSFQNGSMIETGNFSNIIMVLSFPSIISKNIIYSNFTSKWENSYFTTGQLFEQHTFTPKRGNGYFKPGQISDLLQKGTSF